MTMVPRFTVAGRDCTASHSGGRAVQLRAMPPPDLTELLDFLGCRTPQRWLEEARKPENLSLLLCDHANLEQKAAQSAMTTIRRYANGIPGIARSSTRVRKSADCSENRIDRDAGFGDLLHKMSRLAREELRHFEQVLALMGERSIDYVHVSPSRYAGGLRQPARSHEPARLADMLIVGAFIEARSCERFAALAPFLDPQLQQFYLSLLKSESRHYQDYLGLARNYSNEPIDSRIDLFRECEADLISSNDVEFRFHSGVPV